MSTPTPTPPTDDTSILVAIAVLQTKVDALQVMVKDIKTPAAGSLPLTGGAVGAVAALWTLYVQLTGKG